jgi:hypothetical protein
LETSYFHLFSSSPIVSFLDTLACVESLHNLSFLECAFHASSSTADWASLRMQHVRSLTVYMYETPVSLHRRFIRDKPLIPLLADDRASP